MAHRLGKGAQTHDTRFPTPMRHLLATLALTIAAFASGGAWAQAPTHFANCAQFTGRTATLLFPTDAVLTIDGENLQVGDEIAAFTPGGNCAGAAVYMGGALALPVWEDDPYTEAYDGFSKGEALAIHVYQRATGMVVQAAGTGPLVSYDPAYDTKGEFSPDAVLVVTALSLASGVTSSQGVLPLSFGLNSAYPNPFTSTTTLTYSLPAAADVTLEVFDLLGRRVSTLVNEAQGPGRYEVPFDAAALGEQLAAGVYVGVLRTDDQSATIRLTLL